MPAVHTPLPLSVIACPSVQDIQLFFLILCRNTYPTAQVRNSVIGNDHQISETPAWPFLTNMENTPASGSMMTSCLKSEMTSDSIPRPSA